MAYRHTNAGQHGNNQVKFTLWGRVTCVGSSDQFCPERIRLSTRSPSEMESAALLSSIRWDFRLPLWWEGLMEKALPRLRNMQMVLRTQQLLDERSGSFLGQRVALASSHGRRGQTCRWGSCGQFPLQQQIPSCRRRMDPFSYLCEPWQRLTCTGRMTSPCLWPTTCSGCASPEDSSGGAKVISEDATSMRWLDLEGSVFTCRTSWLEARIISLRAGGRMLIPSLKAMDIMAA